MRINRHYFGFVSALLIFLYFCHGDAYLIIWQGIPSEVFFPLVAFFYFSNLNTKKVSWRTYHVNQLFLYILLFGALIAIWVVISLLPPTGNDH